MMNESDLEDIEAHLYSQVFHSTGEEICQEVDNVPVVDDSMTKRTRYFKNGRTAPGPKFQNFVHGGPPRTPNTANQGQGYFSRNFLKPEIAVVLTPKSDASIVSISSGRRRRKQRWQGKMTKFMEKRKLTKHVTKVLKPTKELNLETVVLSDSDDESCIIVDKNISVVSVADSADEEKGIKNEKSDKRSVTDDFSDDVIYIEPVVTPVEIISLDQECDKSSDHVFNSPAKSTSISQIHQERKELLNTPDSASNDFMHNSGIELNRGDFNFSLHGTDFKDSQFLKPANKSESCETESNSSTTTDPNVLNVTKSSVFSEIEFPKDDMFTGNSLENFGNYITPLGRSPNCKEQIQAVPDKAADKCSKQVAYSSDSSSESDFEESVVNDVLRKVKHLPDLSPMQTKCEENNVAPVLKKSKNGTTKASNNDILTDPPNQSKVKKRKSDQDNRDIDNSVIVSGKKKTRSKRKKTGSSASNLPEPRATTSVSITNHQHVEEEELQKKNRPKKITEEVLEGNPQKKEITMLDEIPKTSVEDTSCSENVQVYNMLQPHVIEEAERTPSPNKNLNSTFDGLIIVDEVNATALSDTESVLSALQGEQDIQLINCKENHPEGKHYKDTSKDKSSINLMNSTVEEVQRQMSNDCSLWTILDSDKALVKRRERRCRKCRELGHAGIRCPNKTVPICRLCGNNGHHEPRCPNKICFQCGQRSLYSTTYCKGCFKLRYQKCRICCLMGHTDNICPDLWRRYHLTTTEGPLTIQEGPQLKPPHQQWCPGCAQRGHLHVTCEYYNSVYPPSDPRIYSYEPISLIDESAPELHDPSRKFDRSYQHPQNYYNQPYAQHSNQGYRPRVYNQFESDDSNFNVIGYTSFENQCNYQINEQQHTTENYSPGPMNPTTWKKQANYLFFSSSARAIQQFLHMEIGKLNKLRLYIESQLEHKRSDLVITSYYATRQRNYQKLNMILFGIYKIGGGAGYLKTLKNFKMANVNSRLQTSTRKNLFRAYCYIFAMEKHQGVDYNYLVRSL